MAAMTRTSTLIGRAMRSELPLLQHPQERKLGIRCSIADFVEEDGPAIGQFEAAGATLERAGEPPCPRISRRSTSATAAQFARADGALRALVDRARDDLCGAGLAGDEYRRVGPGRDLRHAREHRAQRWRGAHDLFEHRRPVHLLAGSARFSSRIRCSARLRSSMSVPVASQPMTRSSASRSGALRPRIHPHRPSARRRRNSISRPIPSAQPSVSVACMVGRVVRADDLGPDVGVCDGLPRGSVRRTRGRRGSRTRRRPARRPPRDAGEGSRRRTLRSFGARPAGHAPPPACGHRCRCRWRTSVRTAASSRSGVTRTRNHRYLPFRFRKRASASHAAASVNPRCQAAVNASTSSGVCVLLDDSPSHVFERQPVVVEHDLVAVEARPVRCDNCDMMRNQLDDRRSSRSRWQTLFFCLSWDLRCRTLDPYHFTAPVLRSGTLR